ncbi:MAG: hypothetical protein IK078_09795 [Lachnospiraceae bacterium]|nr:hypothetical protein [Lachnospiraceae bacterium]
MTEEEIKEKIQKLKEAEQKQLEKTGAIEKSLEDLRRRLNKENERLSGIQKDIHRLDGYLFMKLTEEFGFSDYDSLKQFLMQQRSRTGMKSQALGNANENRKGEEEE